MTGKDKINGFLKNLSNIIVLKWNQHFIIHFVVERSAVAKQTLDLIHSQSRSYPYLVKRRKYLNKNLLIDAVFHTAKSEGLINFYYFYRREKPFVQNEITGFKNYHSWVNYCFKYFFVIIDHLTKGHKRQKVR